MAGASKSSDELNPIVRQILEARGIAAAELGAYLNPRLANLIGNDSLPGVVEAATVILATVRARQLIVVFGDYDCDGICATAILTRTLSALGARVEPFLPKRLDEGYGMTESSVSRLLAEYPEVALVVTVDNGINSVEQVAALKARGVAVVVTDHHLPGPELPQADALVNPKVAAPAELESLCGAAVAFMLAGQLVTMAKTAGIYAGDKLCGPLLVLAGLATVTDIMPLLGQNRILVSEALARFQEWAPVGLKELHQRAARSGAVKLTSRDFGFMLGPRINAAGRLKDGLEALELILSDDHDIARELARIIDGYNLERKVVEQKMSDEAMSKVVAGAPAQVIDLPDGHPGVAGIVAARVMERLEDTVPVCVIAGGHGSARAPDGINIRDAFVACAEVLDTFGGHAAAGGFSVKPGRIDEFRRKLCEYCAGRVGRPSASDANFADFWVDDLRELTLSLAEDVARMEPFGEGNAEPVFGLRGVTFADLRTLGQDGRHLSVTLRGSGHSLRAIAWNRGESIEALRRQGSQPHDLTVTLTVSDYGERHLELRIRSIVN